MDPRATPPARAGRARAAQGRSRAGMGAEAKARWLFAAVVVLGSLGAAAWYVHHRAQFDYYILETHDPVSGLLAESPVEYHGVDVGQVARVRLVDSRTVRILLRVEKRAPVTRATVATITTRGVATRGFTGYVLVSLEDAGRDFRALVPQPGRRYAAIPTAPARYDTLDTKIAAVADDVRVLTGLVTRVLDARTVAALRGSLDDVQRLASTLQRVLDPKTVASLGQSVESLRQVASTLQRTLDPKTVRALKASIDNLEIVTRTLADNNARLAALLRNGEEASRRMAPLLASSQDMVRALQAEILPQAQRTLSRLDGLSGSLAGFASQVDRDPSALLRGAARPPPGPGEGG